MTREAGARIFDEVRIRGRNVSLRAYKRRLAILEECKEKLLTLTPDGFVLEEGFFEIVMGNAAPDSEPPDLVVRKQDLISLVYVLEDENRGHLERELWVSITNNLLRKGVAAIFLCWPNAGWMSCAVDLYTFKKYADVSERVVNLGSESFSELTLCIRDFYSQQFLDWNVPDTLQERVSRGSIAVASRAVEQIVQKHFQDLKDAQLRIPAKIQAQSSLQLRDLIPIVNFLTEILSSKEIKRGQVDALRALIERVGRVGND